MPFPCRSDIQPHARALPLRCETLSMRSFTTIIRPRVQWRTSPAARSCAFLKGGLPCPDSSHLLCILTSSSVFMALAQTDDQPASSSTPVTYVYMTRPTHLDGFSVASNGKLTRRARIAICHHLRPGNRRQRQVSLRGERKQRRRYSIATNGSVKLAAANAISQPSGSCGIQSQLAWTIQAPLCIQPQL